MATRRKINCKFCDCFFYNLDDYAAHMEKFHEDMIRKDMTPRQFVYYLTTGKEYGSCIVCKGRTLWNEKTNKYKRLCESKQCHDKYVKTFRERMTNKYGTTTLLNDPEQQKKMLANRSISGTYRWSTNPKYEFTYTGSYEKEFLIFLDRIMEMDPTDIMSPSPHTYYYVYEGKKHFYIPDVFIPSLNLEIEVKDGGSNPNTHPKIIAVDKEKERLKDEVLSSNSIPFDYLKIVNKEHAKFLRYLELSKHRDVIKSNKKIVLL